MLVLQRPTAASPTLAQSLPIRCTGLGWVVLSDDEVRDNRQTMTYSRASDVLFRAVPGYLALSKVDGVPLEVQGPGADVWDLLDRPQAFDQIVDSLAERYGVTPSAIAEDVSQLLVGLERSGFVTHDA